MRMIRNIAVGLPTFLAFMMPTVVYVALAADPGFGGYVLTIIGGVILGAIANAVVNVRLEEKGR